MVNVRTIIENHTINFSLPKKIGEVTINHEIELKKGESYLLEFLQND